MKQHINIKADQQVSGVSTGSGLVTTTNWNPADGASRKQAIEEARLAAVAEQQKREQEQQPLYLRMAALEGEVMRLKVALKDLQDAQKQ